jgi:hypothetical protein
MTTASRNAEDIANEIVPTFIITGCFHSYVADAVYRWTYLQPAKRQ